MWFEHHFRLEWQEERRHIEIKANLIFSYTNLEGHLKETMAVSFFRWSTILKTFLWLSIGLFSIVNNPLYIEQAKEVVRTNILPFLTYLVRQTGNGNQTTTDWPPQYFAYFLFLDTMNLMMVLVISLPIRNSDDFKFNDWTTGRPLRITYLTAKSVSCF